MTQLELIREQIKWLYNVNPDIHIDVALTHPKVSLTNTKVKLVGVYPHIFQIEEYTSGTPKTYTLQYTEIMTRHIVVRELEKCRE